MRLGCHQPHPRRNARCPSSSRPNARVPKNTIQTFETPRTIRKEVLTYNRHIMSARTMFPKRSKTFNALMQQNQIFIHVLIHTSESSFRFNLTPGRFDQIHRPVASHSDPLPSPLIPPQMTYSPFGLPLTHALSVLVSNSVGSGLEIYGWDEAREGTLLANSYPRSPEGGMREEVEASSARAPDAMAKG